MRIKKFSELTGLTPRAIRFYEEKGIFKSIRDTHNSYRIYTDENIEIAKRILSFRKLGFSISEIAQMLKTSPDLSTNQLISNVKRNIEKLQFEKKEIEKKIKQSEEILKASTKNIALSESQKEIYINANSLLSWMANYVNERLPKAQIWSDEELQIVAFAYADLMLNVAGSGQYIDFAKSHKLIEKCLIKIKEPRLAKRHARLADAYLKMAQDPHWQPPIKRSNRLRPNKKRRSQK